MKIESKDIDIESLLYGSFFYIPRFQRPYSWDLDNINDFWNDLIQNKDEEYFIGSMVVYKKAKQQFGIVDGQQRLTTITILLCALRDFFDELGSKDAAAGLHQLIERKDLNNSSEYVLKTETSFPYFQEYIQKYGPPEIDEEVQAEEQNLKNAHELFRALIITTLQSVDHDPTIDPEQKNHIKIQKLASIKTTVLNLKLIFVILDNEDDAYLIFETLNTRGKDLSVTDLAKNHFTKHLKAKGEVDPTILKWTQILETIHNSSADISSDTFIYHFWASRYDAIPLKKLFPVIKKRISKDEAKKYLDSLLSDAKIYRTIHEPTYGWEKNESEIARSLAAIQLFKLSQPTPAILSLVRAYRDGVIKLAKLRDSLQAIEKFHFLFTAITSSRSSGGISAMYSSFAQKLYSSKGPQEASDEISSLIDKLRARRPSFDEFQVAFKEIHFTNNNSKQKNIVRYILRGLSEYFECKFTVDMDELTIEHLVPQNMSGNGGWNDINVGLLGNLIFLDEKMNGKLGTKDFKTKIQILKDNGYVLPDEMLTKAEWTPEDVEAYTGSLAEIAYNKVWVI